VKGIGKMLGNPLHQVTCIIAVLGLLIFLSESRVCVINKKTFWWPVCYDKMILKWTRP